MDRAAAPDPTAETAKAPLRTGEAIFAIGNHGGSPLASFGIVALATGSWRSSRGGTIDNFLRLDLTLSPAAEGGALVDTHGRVLGMTVLGPRRRVLAIPTSTIERAVDQLLARGHVFRAYLGAGLRPVRHERRQDSSSTSSSGRGVLVWLHLGFAPTRATEKPPNKCSDCISVRSK